jgi:hypothetical protein
LPNFTSIANDDERKRGESGNRSAVRDDDFAEVAAAREMAVEVLCRGERKRLVNEWAQAMQGYGRFIASKSVRFPTLIAPTLMPAFGQQ